MKKLSLKVCLALSSLVYILVVFFNTGFIATDEYWDGITRYLPAKTAALNHLIRKDDVKSPLQILPMHAAAQLAYALGFDVPFDQYHFVIVVWGLIGFALCIWAAFLLFARRQEDLLLKVAILSIGFHFAMPGLITRPMFEALAAPWIALACAFAVLYDEKPSWKSLVAGVITISVAFTLRQQTGFCALVFILLPLWHKNWKHFFIASGAGLVCFVLSGIPDIFLRGGFHYSLQALAKYNFEHGGDYSQQPWYFFFPLIFICMVIPWLIARYPQGFLRDYFRRYRSMYVILGLFLILHSLFKNKFERFLISMIPLMVFLIVPFLAYFVENFRQRRWRLISLLVFSLILWFPASFLPAQKNITDLALYVDAHPNKNMLFNIDESIDWIPDVFMLHPYTMSIISSEQLWGIRPMDCNILIVMNDKALAKNKQFLTNNNYKFVALFDVNIIEHIAYELNPEHNVRRSPLTVYGCPNP